jgi:ankyrin repeat protein
LAGAEALACVDLLLRFGGEPHACDAEGLPPVLYAAVSSSIRSDEGADFDLLRALIARESAGGTAAGALRWLCEQGLAGPVDAILVSVASGFAPPGGSAVLDSFSDEGTRSKVGEVLCARQRRLPRDTPLHAAIRVRSVDVCRVLLRHANLSGCLGAVFGLQNGAEAMTPLQLACHVGDDEDDGALMPGSEAVALLSSIDKMMADVGAAAVRSHISSRPAEEKSRGVIISLLLESGAPTRISPLPSQATRRGRVVFQSPLALAITAGHLDAVTVLLTAGAELDEDVKALQEPRAARFEGDCPVCLEASKNCVRLARCRHLMCESCMMKMISFKADSTCPLCRAEI